MSTYTLHVPADAAPGDPRALDRAAVVRDGFSWGAFFFTFLWFFVHGLWIAGLGVLIAVVGLGWGLTALRVGPGTAFWAELLLAVLIGLEAGNLRRWTYARRGRPAVDVVATNGEDAATMKLFARWLARTEAVPPAPVRSGPLPPYRSEPVIGLFPDAERSR